MKFRLMRKTKPLPSEMREKTAAEKVPIFIISCNRLCCLQAAIGSYRKCIGSPYELVIHDNNSTYRPLLDYLKRLEKEGVSVYYSTVNVSVEKQLDTVSDTID
ncbi:MAG TPA: hypothetical protein VJY36_06850, partial [Candidatus Bathyarchaeia archaeon]|nr:hypothetical protein [Candidatus Bathyarchaeia archaeon]